METSCKSYIAQIQQYIDGDLEKKQSMSLFLHARDCSACGLEIKKAENLCAKLSALPEIEAPVDIDEKILASVPYDSYKAMAGIRAVRVPVILEEEVIPVIIRSGVTRVICSTIATLTAAGIASGWLGSESIIVFIAAALPETLVRTQSLFRKRFLTKANQNAS